MTKLRHARGGCISQFPRFFSFALPFSDGEETGRETESATARRTRRERVNPESHGNLATSAIGRTCTRSNLKARSRTRKSESESKREREREGEKERTGHSFIRIRAQYVSYARPPHSSARVVFYLPFTISAPNSRRGPLEHQRKYFHCNEGLSSLHFRVRRPHRSFAYIAPGLPIVVPKFVAAIQVDFINGLNWLIFKAAKEIKLYPFFLIFYLIFYALLFLLYKL